MSLDATRLEEAISRLEDSLEGLDRGRALYVVVSKLVGRQPDKELAVCDPETGRILAYLIPASQHHAAMAAARPPQDALATRNPAPTLQELVAKGQPSKN